MTKYLVLYHAPAAALEKMRSVVSSMIAGTVTPDQSARLRRAAPGAGCRCGCERRKR